jgi:hypothetical protein
MLRVLAVLLLLASSFAQTTIGGGVSVRGGFKNVPTAPPSGGDEFAACKLTDTTGWTLLSSPGNIGTSGNYYLAPNTPLTCDNTCFSPTVDNVTIHLNGNTVTYGANQTEFTFTDQPEVKGTSDGGGETNADQDRIVMKGLWSALTEITRVGNTPGANDYTYGTDYRICADTTYATGHNCGDGRYLIWVGANKPAAGATYYVTGKYKEPASALFVVALSGNTTGFETVPVVGVKTNVGMKCGALQAHANASAWSSGMIHTGNDGFLEDIVWTASNPLAFNQHAWLNEGQTGGTITRVTASSASRWVLSRDNNHGAIYRMMGTGVAGNGTIIENSHILDGPHVGFYVRNIDSVIKNSSIRLRGKYTNGFAASGYAPSEIGPNVKVDCWDSTNLEVGCRGFYLSGSVWAHDNPDIQIHGHNNNLEYGGCEFSGTDNPTGGPYGIQTEGSNSSHSDHNDVVAVADSCGGRARRFSSVGTITSPAPAYFQHEVYRAFKTSAAAPGKAVGLSVTTLYGDPNNAIGAVGADTRIEADTYNIEWLNRGDAIFKRLVLVKGTEDPAYTCGNPANADKEICSHPDPDYHTFRFQGYGEAQTVACIDCEARNGASLTDVSGFVENSAGNWYKHYDLWIKWTRTVHVTDGTGPVAGASVTLTDALSNTYTGTTNANGDVAIVVPQYRIYNTTSAAVNQENRNPFSLTISKTGCNTLNASGITISGTSTDNRTISCPSITLSSIATSPLNKVFSAGVTQQYTATCTWSDSTTTDCTSQVTWASTNGGVSINASGLATDNSCHTGGGNITANWQSKSFSNPFTCTTVLNSIFVAPQNASITVGSNLQYTASCAWSDGSNTSCTSQVSWSSSKAGVTINASGLATNSSCTTGTGTASASWQSHSGNATFTCTSLSSITVAPNNASLEPGDTQAYGATCTWSDSSTTNCTNQVSWSSSNARVTVNASGVATNNTCTSGTSTITATYQSRSGSVTLYCLPAVLNSITVVPNGFDTVDGDNFQMQAICNYSDGTNPNCTSSVTWGKTGGVGCYVSSTGMFTNNGCVSGSGQVSATLQSVTGYGAFTCVPGGP